MDPKDDTAARWGLVCIDVQEGFVNDYTVGALPAIREHLRLNAYQAVIATQFVNAPDSPFRELIKWQGMTHPADIALVPAVAAAATTVLRKTTYNNFDAIAAALAAQQITHVMVVGIDTDVCVLHNAAGLFDLGYEVHVDLAACRTSSGAEVDDVMAVTVARTLGSAQTWGLNRRPWDELAAS